MQRHGLRHRPWVPNRWGSPEEHTRRETSRRITHPRGWTARRGHGPAEHLTMMAARTLQATSRFIPRGCTFLRACMRHTISRRSPARTMIPAAASSRRCGPAAGLATAALRRVRARLAQRVQPIADPCLPKSPRISQPRCGGCRCVRTCDVYLRVLVTGRRPGYCAKARPHWALPSERQPHPR